MFETWSFSLRFLNVINALTIVLEKLLCCSQATCEQRRILNKEPKCSVKKSHVKSVIEWVTVVAWLRLQDMLVELQPSNDAVKADPRWLEVVHELHDQIMTKSRPNHDQIGSWCAMVRCSALMDMALDFRSIQSN